ncbi:MAG TPA: type I restriction endonuclease subunit R [Chloroflexota bacterium]|nr:type I restriction endonuclease subunit R [Chloroflexota bacterium]
MTVHSDSEDALELATLNRLAVLGWTDQANCYYEVQQVPGTSEVPGTLGRETRSDVILRPRLRTALYHLNPELPTEAIEAAVSELSRDRSAMSLVAANQKIYQMLKEGVPVEYPDEEGSHQQALVKVINWREPAQNNFFLAQQLWVTGPHHTRRTDLIGFVNGLPLLLIELKKASINLKHAYEDNLADYKSTIPQLFWYNALILLSNGKDARLGSLTAPWDHFARWKRINSEGESGVISLDTMLRATCQPERLLDLVENFTLFSQGRGETAKIVAKNHQYLGVNNALQAAQDIQTNQGRLGVFWHTQGSGKSYSMAFFSQKLLRTVPGNWTFVIITDRLDLDDQIYKTFAAVGAVTEPEKTVRAQSGQHLQQLLQEDHRYIFTLIQKFGLPNARHFQSAWHLESAWHLGYPKLSDRNDIIVITDEAHRSQYDVLAQNMRTALPNAAFIGFTGTPLMAGEEKTREVFGDYVSIYDFKQSIEDEATVPLYYENRIPEVQIINENFDRDLERILEEAELDEAQEARLEREFAREYHIITRDDRLEKVAADIVQHFVGRGYRGKGMMVSIDKVTAGRMFAKVRAHWDRQLAILRAELESLQVPGTLEVPGTYVDELRDTIAFMAATDMALVVSQGQNEIRQFAEKGLDIRPHRERMNKEPLDEYFKNPDHPLRLVFVCAMWMTGFDVPTCSTIYLDKPMRNHTLMQTIARANRVYKGKNSGTIVDYIGVFRNLQAALAIYGTGRGADGDGTRPIKAKEALIEELANALDETRRYLQAYGSNLDNVTAAQDVFQRIKLIDDAVEALVVNDDTRNGYLNLAAQVERLFKAILPDERVNPYLAARAAVKVIADTIRSDMEPADISGVMAQVEDLLDRSIAGFAIQETAEEPFNLGQIDFEALRKKFEQGRKQTEAMKLRGQLNVQLQRMVRLNKSRADLAEKFEELVQAYNDGRLGVDEFFERLMAFAQELQGEDQRKIAEQLNEEELAIYDLLLKPRPELTKEEIKQVKEVARQMLQALKAEKLVLDWRKKQQARAAVQMTIETWLDKLPAAYSTDMWNRKVQQVYTHIYDNYYGDGRSVYASLGLAA